MNKISPEELEKKKIEAGIWLEVIDKQIEALTKKRKSISDWISKQSSPQKPLLKPEAQEEDYSYDFKNLWILYPSRNGIKAEKQAAYRKFKKIKNLDVVALSKACLNYAKSQEARRGFARDMVRFLKDDYWPMWIKPTEAMMHGTTKPQPKAVSQVVEDILNEK